MKPHFSHQRVRGTPFQVHGRVFVPEAKVTTLIGREASFGANRIEIRGLHVRHIRPVALIESTPQGERLYRIDDQTTQTLMQMLIVALLIPILSIMLVRRLSAR